MEPGFHSSISYKNEVYYPKLKNTSRRDKYLLYILGSMITKCHPSLTLRMTKLDLSVDKKLSHSLKPGLSSYHFGVTIA